MEMPNEPTIVRLKRSKLWVVWGCPWKDRRWCGPWFTLKGNAKDEGAEAGLKSVKRAMKAK